jgi:hypothetical protein
LRAVKTGQGDALRFPGERDHGRPMSNGTILMALKRMGDRRRRTTTRSTWRSGAR